MSNQMSNQGVNPDINQVVRTYDANPFVNKQTAKLDQERKKFEFQRQKQGLPVVSLFSDYLKKS